MLPNLGFGHLIVIIVVGLILFGPNRLPEMMRKFGKAWKMVQDESHKAVSDLKAAVDGSDIKEELSLRVVMDKPDAISLRKEAAATAALPAATASATSKDAASASARKSASPRKSASSRKPAAKRTPAAQAKPGSGRQKATISRPAKKAVSTPERPGANNGRAKRPSTTAPAGAAYPATEDT